MREKKGLLIAVGLLLACAATVQADPGRMATGTFAPTGPPTEPPLRVDAGGGCIVDVKQSYAITGTLTGTLEIDYRIIIEGPCGSPPGTFEEDWIAYGKFAGTVGGEPASAGLSYVAHVTSRGGIDGRLVLGQGLGGELRILGNFSDGKVSYSGTLEP